MVSRRTKFFVSISAHQEDSANAKLDEVMHLSLGQKNQNQNKNERISSNPNPPPRLIVTTLILKYFWKHGRMQIFLGSYWFYMIRPDTYLCFLAAADSPSSFLFPLLCSLDFLAFFMRASSRWFPPEWQKIVEQLVLIYSVLNLYRQDLKC